MKIKSANTLVVFLLLITDCQRTDVENENHKNHIEKMKMDEEIGSFELVGKSEVNDKKDVEVKESIWRNI